MMNAIGKNINEEWKVGDPAKLLYFGNYLYGRFYKDNDESSYYGGKYARVLFLTPGGTAIETGRAYLSKLNEEEEKKLKYWEYTQMIQEDYMGLYGNKIIHNNTWQLNNSNIFKTDEMQYEIVENIVKIKIRRKKVPVSKYFNDIAYNEKLDEGILNKMLYEVMSKLENDYTILKSSVNDDIEISMENPGDNNKIESFVRNMQRELRAFYEENAVHITRMFGSYILLERENGILKAIKATPIPIKYCPLMIKLLKEVGGATALKLLETLNVEDEKLQTKMMCDLINEVVIKGGYFDTNRPLNSCEANVLFGASETMSSAFDADLIDAAVIVSNNLGTIITTNASNTQGAVKRMTGLFYTSPSTKIMETAKDAGIIPVFPYTASIDQIAGVKKAVALGYKKIAVSVAANDNYLHKQLHQLEIENNVTIYKFGLCSTGIDDKTAMIMGEYADIIWSCASKAVKAYIEPKAIAQVGVKIPVHIMTKRGWELVSNHLKHLDNGINFSNIDLREGENKPIFINEQNSIKVLTKKDIHNCLDCPHPCI
jgi:putative methanogenesis marker protein 8